nr:immunoglobulin heavy chain junction region [Macaca mulatta]MOW84359.1 immunoglobulin heavy chain junction region [Macaca mulatta]
CAEGGNFPFYW